MKISAIRISFHKKCAFLQPRVIKNVQRNVYEKIQKRKKILYNLINNVENFFLKK